MNLNYLFAVMKRFNLNGTSSFFISCLVTNYIYIYIYIYNNNIYLFIYLFFIYIVILYKYCKSPKKILVV